MEDYPATEEFPEVVASIYTSFLPSSLVALSFIIILVWELVAAGQVRSNSARLHEQQARIVEQSQQIQSKLEKLARDLIEVAASDDDAKAIVAKYQINVTNPTPTSGPATSATAKP